MAALSLTFIGAQVFAAEKQFLLLPNCFLTNHFPHKVIAKMSAMSLVEVNDMNKFHFMRMQQDASCRNFLNVTSEWREHANKKRPEFFINRYLLDDRYPEMEAHLVQHQKTVKRLFTNLNLMHVRNDLEFLTKLPERHANTTAGLKTAQWIKAKLDAIVLDRKDDEVEIFTIPTVNHALQPSIVLKIGKSKEPGILLGTHMDTLNLSLQKRLGLYQDGSGIVTMLETARILVDSNIHFKRPLYLVWYSGRDEGGLGIQSVLKTFNRQQWQIDTVLEFANTSFGDAERSIGLGDELTDAGLTTFVADLVMTYIKVPVGVVSSGLTCNTQMLWRRQGSKVIYPFSSMHDAVLGQVDRVRTRFRTFSLPHLIDFVKLSVAFAVEMAEPV